MKRIIPLLSICTLFALAACQEDLVSPAEDLTPLATLDQANSDNAAIVINQDVGLCGMPGSDADGNLIFGGVGEVNLVLENNNKVMLSCKGSDITNLSGKAQSFSEFGCGIIAPDGDFFGTTDSRATVSASGRATLTCTYEK